MGAQKPHRKGQKVKGVTGEPGHAQQVVIVIIVKTQIEITDRTHTSSYESHT